jgi:hypothetical protein
MDVNAPTLPALFERAAAGMACLLYGADGADGGDDAESAPATGSAAAASHAPDVAPSEAPGSMPLPERSLTLSADDLPALLRAWLRELLYWHEADGVAVGVVRFATLTPTRLEAMVTLRPEATEPIREIKGVTFHGLAVEQGAEGWTGRVIFDV